MAVDATQIVGGAIGGALITSVLQPIISQRGARRDVRADVLRRVGDVESTRWAETGWDEFRAATVHLRAAGLVAGANRSLVDRYLYLALVARRQAEKSWAQMLRELGPNAEELGSSIPIPLGELVRDAATLLTESLWHPYRDHWSVRRRLRALEDRERELRDSEDGQDFNWSEPHF
jgi:hypothetical protein